MTGRVMAALALLMAFAVAPALAADPVPTTGVAQQYQSSMTCVSVQVSSYVSAGFNTATLLDGATNFLWRSVSVQNRDATANVFVSENISVSSGTSFSALTGWQLPPGNPGGSTSFYLQPGQALYAINDSASKVAAVTVCKGR